VPAARLRGTQRYVEAGSGALTLGTPSSPGVPKTTTSSTVSVTYNDLDSAKQVFEKYTDKIACFVVEPVAGNMGVVVPGAGYLQGLRELCNKYGAMLLFDEADSLFAKRTSVSSSHDRYANLETNYLLQRIEEHPGISILTTNNAQSIDPAFARRIQFRVDFPFPDAKARAEIWRRCLTPEVPREQHLDFQSLGEVFDLSGANIKAAVLRAVFAAATTGWPVTTSSLADAAAREFENAGKLPPAFKLPRR
jgi:hypothetical protein